MENALVCRCIGEQPDTPPGCRMPSVNLLACWQPLQFGIDGLFEPVDAARLQQTAVDEHAGGPANTSGYGILHIPTDSALHFCRFLALLEISRVQPQFGGDLVDFLIAELVIIFKKAIVKSPEFTLTLSHHRGGGSFKGVRMIAQGIMFKDHFNPVGVLLEHLLEYRHQPGAIRSLKVAEDHHCHRRVRVALKWTADSVDRVGEIHQRQTYLSLIR